MIHDIKLTFKKEGASFKFTGFTDENTSSTLINVINKDTYEYLNIDTPFGKRYIQLYVESIGASGASGASGPAV